MSLLVSVSVRSLERESAIPLVSRLALLLELRSGTPVTMREVRDGGGGSGYTKRFNDGRHW